MHPSLTLIDEFVAPETATAIRNKVLELGFKDIEFMQGLYQGTNMDFKPPELKAALEAFFGREVEIKVQAFRSGHRETHLHVNIHADNPIAQWAGVYYLNLPEDCDGGTAFYRMKEMGWETMPTQEQMDAMSVDLDWVREKWVQPKAWDLISLAGMKFNRFIFYPTSYFHSRYPLEGWGEPDDLAHARLVWVVFFNVL